MRRSLAGLVLALGVTAAMPAFADSLSTVTTHELTAQTRPHITIYPRRGYVSPNAKRQCRSTLVQDYRVSGPVIVPKMRCWWE
jgi:hypothetical protein